MDGSHGNGDDTLYLNDHTTVTGTFHFQENSLLTLKVTTDDADFRTFRQIQFIRLEVHKMIVVGSGYGNEALHLIVGDDYLLTATGIGDILQVSDF